MLISLNDLEDVRRQHSEKVIVLTSGTFDMIHVGHIRYLEKAKSLGDILIVLTGSDTRVKNRKGADRPIMPVEDRVKMLLALKAVDYVIIDPNDESPGTGHPKYIELISKLNPDICATDEHDPRFIDIVDPAKQVTLDRQPGGRFNSTSEILQHLGFPAK